MNHSLVCYNCCALSTATSKRDDECPNCGGSLSRRQWPLSEMLECSRSDAECSGDALFENVGPLYFRDVPGLLTYATNAGWLAQAITSPNVATVFARREDADKLCDTLPGWEWPTIVLSDRPEVDFFLFHNYLVDETDFYGERTLSVIGEAAIHPSAHVSGWDVVIGDGVVVGPNASIHSGVVIGDRTRISVGAVIGVEGARLIKKPGGGFFPARHGGAVEIGEDVFIGANAVIVKSMWWKPTKVGDHAFVGNLANVGHNSIVHDDATVLPGAMICGRAEVMPGATVALGAVVSNGIVVGRDAWVTIGAVVTKDVPPGTRVSGNFAVDHQEQLAHVKRKAAGRWQDEPPGLR